MTINTFEDLKVWQEARRLTNRIYDAIRQPPFSKDFELIGQIKRAAISIGSNIAEGYERGGTQEFLQFLSIAKGSSGEVRSQLYLALDRCYMEKEECDQLIGEFKKLSIMINGFMKYLKTTAYRGAKYKNNV